ncbi:MAG: plasmid pRiA4b ORF-3 family protein, partial [Planctomycetes bacterium]|nr:plasmid pRiA4b ORF-3 family protein [Planctomycetota bacterium]
DGWLHKIVLGGVHPSEAGTRYPRCLAGARACPPEDCGGIGGYEDLLETLKNPETEECKEIQDWLGRPFDPEAFDPETVVFEDPQERWKEVFGSRGKS